MDVRCIVRRYGRVAEHVRFSLESVITVHLSLQLAS